MDEKIKLPPPGLWFTKDKWKYTESQWNREIGYGELPPEHSIEQPKNDKPISD